MKFKKFNCVKKAIKNLKKKSDIDFNEYFLSIDERQVIGRFFYIYFQKGTNPFPTFLKRFAERLPNLFIKVLRKNKVPFLCPKTWNTIKSWQLESIQKWVDALDFFRGIEEQKWKVFETKFQAIPKCNIYEVFILTSWWYERNYDINVINRESRVKVIGHFLSYYIHKFKKVHRLGNRDVLYKFYSKMLRGLQDNHPIFLALDALLEWQEYKESEFYTICYDDNYTVQKRNNIFELIPISCEKLEQWLQNGKKYQRMYDDYCLRGKDVANDMIRMEEVIIPKLDTEWGDYNLKGFYENITGKMLLDDSFVEGYNFHKGTVVELDIQGHLDVFNGFYNNAKKHFRDLVDYSLIMEGNTDFKYRLENQIDTDILYPNLSIREDEYTSWCSIVGSTVNRNGKLLTDNEVRYVENLLVQKIDYNDFEEHNCFDPKIENILIKPFFKIGKWVFSYSNLLGDCDQWIYIVLQSALDTNNRYRTKKSQEEIKEMSKALAEQLSFRAQFDNVGYDCYYKKKTDKGHLSGDIDLLIYENGHLFLGELKRTKFRLNLEEAWLEDVQHHQKAINQLDKHVDLLKMDPIFFCRSMKLPEDIDVEKLQIHRFLISNSFEDNGTYFGNDESIRKISYYELDKLIRNLDFNTIRESGRNAVEELVKELHAGSIWK